MTDTYPPFTPINCKFFFVKGDPGSPSAFRFIIDLREDCGDEAGKDTSDHTYCRKMTCSETVRMMVRGLIFCSVQLPVLGSSCDWTASADVGRCLSPSLECNKPI